MMRPPIWSAFALLALCTVGESASAAISGCAANYSIDISFTGGNRWEMCWQDDTVKGLVLNQVTLTPRNGSRTQILQTAALAQLQQAYDDNSARTNVLTERGLPLATLTAADCPGGSLLRNSAGTAMLCQMVVPRGYAWRGNQGQVQGESLVVFGLGRVNNATYIHKWIFNDDGAIQPQLGVTGDLEPQRRSDGTTGWPLASGVFATNRFHTAYWRLDFAIGGQGNDQFQQVQYTASGDVRSQSVDTIATEGRFEVNPDAQRFWLVKDTQLTNANGHNLSYQIVPQHTSLHRSDEGYTLGDVYVTQTRACEQFANQNPTNGCAGDLPGYLNGETLSDLVVWAGTTWHQVPRSEDATNAPVHWQGLSLAPRDFSASSPLL